MDTLFSSINLNVNKSPDSTIDLKLLDTVCNHQILREELTFDTSIVFSNVVYSGGTPYGGGAAFSGGINPDATIIVTTALPLGNTSYQFFEIPNSSNANPLIEEFTVPSDLTQRFRLSFPPVPNTTTAQLRTTEIDEDNETQTLFFPFNNYSISQLFGVIQFNNIADVGSTVDFSYVGDIREIFANSKVMEPNWQFLGYDQTGRGIFKFYGRAFLANQSKLYIRYFTTTDFCPRCAGSDIINDLDINPSTNRFYSVYDFSKLIQDFFKRFLTEKGSNPFDPSDGTQVPIFIGLGKNNPSLIDTLIRTEVINLIDVLRLKQNKQAIIQGISLAEQIQQINQLSVVRANTTDVNVLIEVMSRSQATAQLNTTIQGN